MSTIVSSFNGRVEIMKKKGENISTSSPIWWDFGMMPPKCGGPVITFIGACRRKMFNKFGIKVVVEVVHFGGGYVRSIGRTSFTRQRLISFISSCFVFSSRERSSLLVVVVLPPLTAETSLQRIKYLFSRCFNNITY